MKIRSDFVTNSSSSSFVCEICGEAEIVEDGDLADAGMCQCENGHEMCEHHVDDVGFDTNKKLLLRSLNRHLNRIKTREKNQSDDLKTIVRLTDTIEFVTNLTEDDMKKDYENEYRFTELLDDYDLKGTIPIEVCPLCTHKVVTDCQKIEFALSKLDMSLGQLTEMTREYLIQKDAEKNK